MPVKYAIASRQYGCEDEYFDEFAVQQGIVCCKWFASGSMRTWESIEIAREQRDLIEQIEQLAGDTESTIFVVRFEIEAVDLIGESAQEAADRMAESWE